MLNGLGSENMFDSYTVVVAFSIVFVSGGFLSCIGLP